MNKKLTFEQAIERLEEIVNRMENENPSLEESLKLFEEGSKLSSLCYGKLSEAEQKIRNITELEEKAGKSDGSD